MSKPADDSQAIHDVFDTYAKAALANDGAAAMPVLTSSTFTFYESRCAR